MFGSGRLDVDTSRIKGFLDEEEAQCLYRVTLEAGKLGNALEIGSYCGKSAIYIGKACQENAKKLYSIDHHCGSAEQQFGEQYFDADLYDEHRGCVDTLPHFLVTIDKFALTKTVEHIIGESTTIARDWREPLAMVFIDGGHSFADAYNDYNCWASWIVRGGFLVIHDIFESSSYGGQAPRCIYEAAIASLLFIPVAKIKTLGILRRIAHGDIPPAAIKNFELMNGE